MHDCLHGRSHGCAYHAGFVHIMHFHCINELCRCAGEMGWGVP